MRASPPRVTLRIACAWLIVVPGCLSTPRVETILHQSPEGMVSLREFPDAAYQADHPVSLEPALVRRVIAGLRIKERQTLLESTFFGAGEWMPVFTSREIAFLTPLLAAALERATPSEAVRFRVTRPSARGTLATAGAVHAAGGTLHLALVEYGAPPSRPGTLSQPSRSFNRATRWTLSFLPEEALVDRKADTPATTVGGEPPGLRISLATLARLPGRELPGQPSAGDAEGASGRHDAAPDAVADDPARGAVETRGEEVDRLHRRLQEQEERLERLERHLEKR